MKAKEYAEKVIGTSGEQSQMKALGECGIGFIKEFDAIRHARNISTDQALIPLIKEFNDKWIKFAFIVNQKEDVVKLNGFIELLNHISPMAVTYYREEMLKKNINGNT